MRMNGYAQILPSLRDVMSPSSSNSVMNCCDLLDAVPRELWNTFCSGLCLGPMRIPYGRKEGGGIFILGGFDARAASAKQGPWTINPSGQMSRWHKYRSLWACRGVRMYANLAWILPRLLRLLEFIIFFSVPSHPWFKPAAIWRHVLPLYFSGYGPRPSKIKDREEWATISSTKGSRWSTRSSHGMFELTVCRETASSHQETKSNSQKRTPKNNTISQAVHI